MGDEDYQDPSALPPEDTRRRAFRNYLDYQQEPPAPGSALPLRVGSLTVPPDDTTWTPAHESWLNKLDAGAAQTEQDHANAEIDDATAARALAQANPLRTALRSRKERFEAARLAQAAQQSDMLDARAKGKELTHAQADTQNFQLKTVPDPVTGQPVSFYQHEPGKWTQMNTPEATGLADVPDQSAADMIAAGATKQDLLDKLIATMPPEQGAAFRAGVTGRGEATYPPPAAPPEPGRGELKGGMPPDAGREDATGYPKPDTPENRQQDLLDRAKAIHAMPNSPEKIAALRQFASLAQAERDRSLTATTKNGFGQSVPTHANDTEADRFNKLNGLALWADQAHRYTDFQVYGERDPKTGQPLSQQAQQPGADLLKRAKTALAAQGVREPPPFLGTDRRGMPIHNPAAIQYRELLNRQFDVEKQKDARDKTVATAADRAAAAQTATDYRDALSNHRLKDYADAADPHAARLDAIMGDFAHLHPNDPRVLQWQQGRAAQSAALAKRDPDSLSLGDLAHAVIGPHANVQTMLKDARKEVDADQREMPENTDRAGVVYNPEGGAKGPYNAMSPEGKAEEAQRRVRANLTAMRADQQRAESKAPPPAIPAPAQSAAPAAASAVALQPGTPAFFQQGGWGNPALQNPVPNQPPPAPKGVPTPEEAAAELQRRAALAAMTPEQKARAAEARRRELAGRGVQ